MMIKKIFPLLCMIIALFLLFTSCINKNQANNGTGSVLIGIAMPESHVDRWVKDGASLKKFAESRGYRAETSMADANQDLQNEQIRKFLQDGAKLLIIGSINEGVIPAVADAAKAKVPVIAYDRIISNSADYDYYITFNNYEVGTFQGKGIEDGLDLKNAAADNPKYITFFAGAATDGNAFFYYDGALDVLRPYIEKGVLKVVGP
ncbi:MAG: substrate-binding domain-containing protein, partial [Treponema sp.]|nr:substrate-binding domain-containing protein [Treponema sp.]